MSIRAITAVLLGGCLVSGGCSRGPAPAKHRDAGLFMPETIGAVSLEDPEAFAPEYREAARAAALYLTQRGRRPDLAFAQLSKRASGEVAIDVWPASMFGHAKPHGGGGMTLLFEPRTHRIEKALGWQ